MQDFNSGGLTPIRQEVAPLRTRIIESMRRAIERGFLKPGERLVEKDLCEQLGVSRTSLREALRELEAEGVIAQAPARGLVVAKISRRDAENIYLIRGDVEALIIGQFINLASDAQIAEALENCDTLIDAYKQGEFADIVEAKRAFYAHICEVAGNGVAMDLLSRLTLRTAQLRSHSVVRKERQAQSVQEIHALAEAIRARDSDAARHAAKTHVENAARSALAYAEP
ncbi:GntR family transcriptional regulator [Thetidibacter halocola]|uniref:GntR family transcriptional regulator n=1 Tax=Thetidibacter halocola TaxID=2827239 RepID=A0A8J7WB59_9RHOB|nr:GntR family transcriptional regulator [Thetidibacter halocola]MBS0124325.1 GntR family transcriptional regulator [Thetidibacter halocola]